MTTAQRQERAATGAAPRAGALAVLVALCLWALWPQVTWIARTATRSSDTIHALIIPLAILLLILRRREALLAEPWKGSAWAVAWVVGGLALYAVAIWPFSFGNARDGAIVLVLAGAILAVYGWGVLRLSVPMLLLLLLSIPIGARLYVSVVGRVDVAIIRAVAATLDLLPGVHTRLIGPDLFYAGSKGSGPIAIGDAIRGARLLQCLAAVGVFVTFWRIRSRGRIVAVAIAAGPIVLFCAFLQLLIRALLTIYWQTGLGGTLDRSLSAVLALLACYALFLLACSVKVRLFVEEESDQEDSGAVQPPVGRPAGAAGRRGRVVSWPAIACAVILVTAAVALRPCMAALEERYSKAPIAVRQPLSEFRSVRLSPFQNGWTATRMDLPFEDIGTDEYVFIDLKRKGSADPWNKATFRVSYYSKPGHKIPHSPDTCYSQAGAVILSDTTCVIDCPKQPPEYAEIPARLLRFKQYDHDEIVIFCFFVEGQFTTSRKRARWLVTKPGNRRTYFSLISTSATCPPDGDASKAIETCKQAFREGIPILLAEHFPTNEQLTRR